MKKRGKGKRYWKRYNSKIDKYIKGLHIRCSWLAHMLNNPEAYTLMLVGNSIYGKMPYAILKSSTYGKEIAQL